MNRLLAYLDPSDPRPVPLMKIGFGVGFGWFGASMCIELFRYLLLHLAVRLGLPL